MKLEKILGILISEFEDKKVEYALIGGYALGLLGVSRATIDLDFLVNLDDMGKVDIIMTELGYEKKYASENVAQYVSPDKLFGEVDFLHAFRNVSRKMLSRAQSKKIFSGKHSVRVLRPEDIIGLKIQAVANNPSRERLEFVDIVSLAERYGKELDWELIKDYFSLFDKVSEFEALRREVGEADGV